MNLYGKSQSEPRVEPPETLAFRAASSDRALFRIARRDLPLQTVIDVGASNGMWSAVAMKHYPSSHYLLVEAQKVHLPALRNFCAAHPNAEFVLAAAGDRVGEIFFDDNDPFGGVASHSQRVGMSGRVPLITIDQEVASRGLPGPYLVKLDTHGFEVPILEGARETLKHTNLVVIEVYNFKISPDSLLFADMCKFMEGLGFGVIDMSEPMWRTHDHAFWQMDLFFIPLDRKEFSHTAYA